MTWGDGIALFAAVLSTIITIIGWHFTYNKQKELEEHEIRFTYSLNHSAEIMNELYKLIDRITELYLNSTRQGRFDGERPLKDQQNDAFLKFAELQDFYFQNQIYFNHDLGSEIENFISTCMEISKEIGFATHINPTCINDPRLTDSISEHLLKAAEIINTKLPPIKEVIKQKIQNIILPPEL